MSIRIYALAQQLKVETKKLIDVLKQLGIEGKGSSLASLTEEEVEKVKAAVQKTQAKSSKPGNNFPDTVFKRPSGVLPDKKIRVLEPHTKKEVPPSQPAEHKEVKETPAVSVSPDVARPTENKSVKKEKEPEIVSPQESSAKESPKKELPPAKELPKELSKKELPPAKESPVKGSLPSFPTLPPPLGRIELPPSEPKGGTSKNLERKGKTSKSPESKGGTPKNLERKDGTPKNLERKDGTPKNLERKGGTPKNLEHKGGTPNIQVPKGGLPKKSTPLNAFLRKSESSTVPAPPITTGLSEPGHAVATRRDDYRGPMRDFTDKIPNLDTLRKKPEGTKPSHSQSSKPTGPSIRIAPVPKAPTPKTPKIKEPTPQKPDMVLPKDIIRSVITDGTSKELENHIRKHEERQRIKDEERKKKDFKDKEKRKHKKKTSGQPDNNDEQGKGGRGQHQRSGLGIGETATPLIDETKKKRRSGATRRHNRNDYEEEAAVIPRQLKRQRNRGRAVSTAAPRKTDIVIQLPCSVKQFAEQTGLSVPIVIKKLLEMGTPMMINSQLDRESSELLAEAFGIRLSVRDQISLEDRLVVSLFEEEDPPELLKPRPPVVTVLGHVDHGKTTLLDHILHLNVVSGEKGGITQHIRAYRVKMENGEDITFVDTPGHEAFTEMRARGANCTDIVVLVVAADDGVMPQTEEAISHAKAAGVPIIVALNKMDLVGVHPERVIQELAAHELMPSEWGGDVEVIRCSGLTGLGVDKLLETIQVIAELHELKANPNRSALGVALEAELQSGQGVVCKVLVQNGTLQTGDVVLCGTAYGRVKVMYDTLDTKKIINKAIPSTPVQLIGLNTAPSAGSKFCVLDDISDARTIAEQRLDEERKNLLADVRSHVTLETLFQRINSAQAIQTLNVIIRADVRGSIEAIRKELGKLDHPEVKIKILQATVGGISEADVQLADASDAIIVGFNVVPDENARIMADRKKIQIRRYDIIYNLTDDIKKALEGMLKPIEQIKELGRALVQRVFVISRLGAIAGCRVVSGTIERDCRVRIIRDSRIIGEYPLDSLKREKDDVKEVREGYECGMKLKGFNDLKEGDILETYKIEEIARTF
ncbi:MAG: translation initiation factor IF-2 [Planctomycetaceae bacterium]|nr:translation initiation factor IF-2 [Planctomycetaceae bacterium]